APIDGTRKTEKAAREAVALDENLAESHAALALAHIAFAPSNFQLGDRELRRAIELSPSLALAHGYLAFSLARQGRPDESLEEILKARELDPLSPIIARGVAFPYYLKRDYPRALELLRQANELGPAFTTTWEIGVYIAKIYATLNEKEMALSWLERGLATGAIGSFYKDEPVWDPIRRDPRFTDLVRRMGTPLWIRRNSLPNWSGATVRKVAIVSGLVMQISIG